MDLLLHHTTIIPAPSVLAVHHSQAREALGGLFFLTRGILFQDLAVGWLDNYIATASSITLRLAPAAILEHVAPERAFFGAATPGRARGQGFREWGGNSNLKRNLSPSESDGLRFPLKIQFWVLWR